MSVAFRECPLDGEAPTPGWAPVWQYLQTTAYHRLEADRERVARAVAENEVTYTTLDAGRVAQQAWRLDSVPYVIDGDEFAGLAAGVVQRGRLLEAVLADCHGPRRLVSEGILPAALLYGHPHFLRACSGWRPRGGWLHVYACDAVRGPDGRFAVLADRCQAPIGLGYALENRLAVAAVHEARFRQAGTQRLADFYAEVKAALHALAIQGSQEPRIALLSAGEGAESAGEHAFLARYLGCDLVEGGDLTARGDRIYLKTLGGLERIDVLLRRVGDVWSDALELRGDSVLGVPGLLGAARTGQLALANALGCALVESAAVQPYLPAACRLLLGEDMLLTQVDSWWLGDAAAPDAASILAGDQVLRPAAPDALGRPVFTADLSAAERSTWMARLRAEPAAWTASRRIAPSLAPAWLDGRIGSSPVGLRFFAVRRQEDWRVMPGGLARMAADAQGRLLSFRYGGGSKDCWVLGGVPSAPMSVAQSMADVSSSQELRRGGVAVPSRLLDDVFWLGRSLERSEWLLRLGHALLAAERQEAGSGGGPLLAALARSQGMEPDARPALHQLVAWHRGEHAGGLPAQLAAVHANAQRVRAHLAPEALRRVGRLHRAGKELARRGDNPELLEELLDHCLALAGTIAENMVRGHAWSFLDLGRRLERGLRLAQTVAPLVRTGNQLDLLLLLGDCRLAYRARYRSRIQPAPVYDLVLCDASNPRGLAHQTDAIEAVLERLPLGDNGRDQAQRLARRLAGGVRRLDPHHADTEPEALAAQLDGLTGELEALAQAIDLQYFSHAVPAVQLGPSALAVREDGGVQQ